MRGSRNFRRGGGGGGGGKGDTGPTDRKKLWRFCFCFFRVFFFFVCLFVFFFFFFFFFLFFFYPQLIMQTESNDGFFQRKLSLNYKFPIFQGGGGVQHSQKVQLSPVAGVQLLIPI